jgi:hypothetical protein
MQEIFEKQTFFRVHHLVAHIRPLLGLNALLLPPLLSPLTVVLR